MAEFFRDRRDAGHLLGERLLVLGLKDPLVLGIPRGGVEVGAGLARALGAELDIVLAHKLRSPRHPELAVGALGENGEIYLNHHVRGSQDISSDYLQQESRKQAGEMQRRRNLYRQARPPAVIKGRSVILTDDGIATGSTMFAAIEVVKGNQPHDLTIAIPVAPADQIEAVRKKCDRLLCLYTPKDFWAVGQYYDSFDPVTDKEVLETLRAFAEQSNRHEQSGPDPPLDS